MKILITESQIENLFNDYLRKFRPELFELSRFPVKRLDKSIYGYEFEVEDTLILMFEYFIEDEHNKDNYKYPKLRITHKLSNEIEGMFGKEGIKLLAKWFEDYYKLPVKTVVGYL